MSEYRAKTYDELQTQLLRALVYEHDYECRPRGQLIREKLAVTLRLKNPRARLSTSPSRAANYGFAAGEFLWYLRGANDLESITYYNKRMRDFSDDGKTLNSAYGHRLMAVTLDDSKRTQWQDVADELRRDPDSRRAVMTIFSPSDLRKAVARGSKDVPCTLALQFFIRDKGIGRELHLHVSMRSNDAVWGLCNDVFSFTLLQEVMALDLMDSYPGLELGEYAHTAGSMHVYERHFDLAKQVSREPPRAPALSEMPRVLHRAELTILIDEERSLRERGTHKFKFKGGAQWLLDKLADHRIKREVEALCGS